MIHSKYSQVPSIETRAHKIFLDMKVDRDFCVCHEPCFHYTLDQSFDKSNSVSILPQVKCCKCDKVK